MMKKLQGSMTMKLTTAIFLALMIPAMGAQAQTGNELRAGIQGWEILQRGEIPDVSTAMALGRLSGLVRATSVYSPIIKTACPPASYTAKQGTAVTVKWLKEHSEKWGEDDVQLVSHAFKDTWPCP